MKRLTTVFAVVSVLIVAAGPAQGDFTGDPYGLAAELDLRATISLKDGLVLTFCSGHGMNGADAYVYTDVGGSVEENQQYLGTWPNDTSSWHASATTSNGDAHGDVTVNTAGFDYSIHADAMVQGLAIGDYGLAMGDAYGWPDWLRNDTSNPPGTGTATITLDYTYTLDTQQTIDVGKAYVYMNAFFADHAHLNYLTTKDAWEELYTDNPNGTKVVQYMDSIGADDYVTLTDSVSWDITIPNTGEPYNWWSLWAYGEVAVEAEPVPVPGAVLLGILGLSVAGWKLRKFA